MYKVDHSLSPLETWKRLAYAKKNKEKKSFRFEDLYIKINLTVSLITKMRLSNNQVTGMFWNLDQML